MASEPETLGEGTRAVHLPSGPVPAQRPLAEPLYRATTYAFESSAQYAAVLNGSEPGYTYARIDNPTTGGFAAAVAALEGAGAGYPVAGQAFASGMAAISTVFWAFTRAGARVLAPAALYGGTYSFLVNVAARFGVHTDFADMTDLDAVAAALRPETAIVYAETIANPTMAVTDLAALAGLAREAGALLVVDSTLAPPPVCRPLTRGADLSLHSATKYIGGHSDATGGVACGRPELIAALRAARIDLGGSLAPDEAWLLRRGLETLPLRVARQCSTAAALAAGLAGHPAVEEVAYPGLPGHCGHDVALRQFTAGPEGTRFGGMLSVTPRGGRAGGQGFADRLRVATVATSLGGNHTKASHGASTTHRQLDAAALAAAGIAPGAVRISVGLEDAADLLADAIAALDGPPAG